MLINENAIRWIRSAIKAHFDTNKGSHTLYVEGEDRDKLKGIQAWAECRVDGPRYYERGGEVRFDSVINILLVAYRDPKDLYVIDKLSGKFAAAFTDSIAVYKRGNGPADDNSLFGCLVREDVVKYNYFGIVDTSLKDEQATLEARYHLYPV